MVSSQNNVFTGKRSFKFKLPQSIKKSFDKKEIYYLYRSLITGQKRGVKKSTKKILKSLQLIHLLTPSGLHFSSLLMIIITLRRRFKSKYLLYLESLICICTYLFLPGYFSLRRVAFLRFLFLVNSQFQSPLSKAKVFIFFFTFDLFFGTFIHSPLSFSYSMMFLTIIFLTEKVSFLKLIPLFFLGQLIIAFVTGSSVNLITLIISPCVTWLFSFFYPLLFTNLLSFEILNYSQLILKVFVQGLEYTYELVNPALSLTPNLLTIIGILLIGRRTSLLSVSIITISFLIPNQ